MVVVGAGPAGCAAAYDLAVRGIRVVLLDRRDFPRLKPCAGGLTTKALHALRYSIAPVIQRTVCSLAVSCRSRHSRRFTVGEPICHMVERASFDTFCFRQTVATGADFRIVRRIDHIAEYGSGVRLSTDLGAINCRYLIGADGVHSRVRRLTGRFTKPCFGFAIEGVVASLPSSDADMGFDFSQVAGGYGWGFPKRDHINVGLYTHWPRVQIQQRDLVAYAGRKFSGMRPERVRGYPLGMGGWRYRPGCGRILLAGDAAGLVDPLLGEGLYHAIISGQHAAAAIQAAMDSGSDACLNYAGALRAIQRELLFARLAAAFFYRFPVLGHGLLTSPAARLPLMEGFARGLTLLKIFLNGYRFWLDASLPDGR